MFGRKSKQKATRSVSVFSELEVNDLIIFKPREVLPHGVSDDTLTVEKIGGYDYNGSLSTDFTLRHSSGLRFSASYDAEDDTITLGRKLKQSEVLSIFNEDDFADIFEEELGGQRLNADVDNLDSEYQAWIAESYSRAVYAGIAYYYDEDRRSLGISSNEDSSQQFTYFELEGANDRNSLSIEIWEDGETDVFCEVTVKSNVVDTYLCHE